MKFVPAVLVACTLAAPLAMAQTATPPTPSTNNASTAAAPVAAGGQWRASKLMGVAIYNQQNEKIGDVNEILVDGSGRVDGVIVGVGGFLGMGEHDVKMSIDKIRFTNEAGKTTTGSSGGSKQWYPDRGTVNASKDELKAMPQFKY